MPIGDRPINLAAIEDIDKQALLLSAGVAGSRDRPFIHVSLANCLPGDASAL